MKPVISCVAISALSLLVSSEIFAANRMGASGATHAAQPKALGSTHTTGQPNKSCETTPNPPGNSASAPGSPFNPNGTSGGVYAGEQPQNSRNPKSVSQYDAACARPH